MTNITVQKPKGLERTVQVVLTGEEFSLAVNKKYNSLAGKIAIPGYRKGKVPRNVVESKYGNSIVAEVTQDLVSETLQTALKEHDLNPVEMPNINIKSNSTDKGLDYEAVFEEYPKIEMMDFSKVKLNVPSCSISKEDIKEGIERVKEQNISWSVTDKKSKKGDMVTVDFEGTIDKEPFEGGSAKDFKVVLGKGQVLPEFEKALSGVVAGNDVTAKATFPKDYHAADLAGKKAEFKIKVIEVSSSSIGEIDAEFLKKCGIESGDIKDLEKEVENNLNLQLNRLLFEEKQKRVFDVLEKHYKKTLVPKSLVLKEAKHAISSLPKDQQDKYKDITADSKEKIVTESANRVILSLVCQQIIESWDIKLDEKRFMEYMSQMSSAYMDREQFMRWFLQDKNNVEKVKHTVLEQQMIDAIIEKTSNKEETISFKKLSEQHNK